MDRASAKLWLRFRQHGWIAGSVILLSELYVDNLSITSLALFRKPWSQIEDRQKYVPRRDLYVTLSLICTTLIVFNIEIFTQYTLLRYAITVYWFARWIDCAVILGRLALLGNIRTDRSIADLSVHRLQRIHVLSIVSAIELVMLFGIGYCVLDWCGQPVWDCLSLQGTSVVVQTLSVSAGYSIDDLCREPIPVIFVGIQIAYSLFIILVLLAMLPAQAHSPQASKFSKNGSVIHEWNCEDFYRRRAWVTTYHLVLALLAYQLLKQN